MVVSPNPSPAEYKALDRLCPIAVSGLFNGNRLTSNSTRTEGLVTNTDIAPTIAAYFGVRLRTAPYGSLMSSYSPGLRVNEASWFLRFDRQAIRQARWQLAVPYCAGALAALMALLSAGLFRGPMGAVRSIILINIAILCLLSFPVSYQSGFLPMSGVLFAFAFWPASRKDNVYFTVGITVFCLYDAIAFHGRIAGGSLLGYSPIEGARYYGVGNEVMGLWIGMTTYVCCVLAEKPRWKWAALPLALAVIVALGLPDAGAKAGGFLVGVITLAAALWTRTGRRITPLGAAVGVASLLAFGVAGLLAFGRFFGESHVTRAIALTHAQGASALLGIVARKAGMDIHLMFHSVWMITLIVASVTSYWALRPIWNRSDFPRTLFVALIAATVSSLVLNDAGVVAAALCSLTLWSSAMLARGRSATAAPASTPERIPA
jgi:hypothetical protein